MVGEVQHDTTRFLDLYDYSDHFLPSFWRIKLQRQSCVGVFMKSKFEAWFQQQPFYLNLCFIHGDQLFTSENGVYRVLAVQIAWATWQEQQKWLDAAKTKWISVTSIATTYPNSLPAEFFQKLDELHDVLCSYISEQESQACDHTMVEKTQFGDLERSFECIFCDHKTTEAWVTKHE